MKIWYNPSNNISIAWRVGACARWWVAVVAASRGIAGLLVACRSKICHNSYLSYRIIDSFPRKEKLKNNIKPVLLASKPYWKSYHFQYLDTSAHLHPGGEGGVKGLIPPQTFKSLILPPQNYEKYIRLHP